MLFDSKGIEAFSYLVDQIMKEIDTGLQSSTRELLSQSRTFMEHTCTAAEKVGLLYRA